ncbi:MAG: hypothetical protein AAGG00_01385 [Cyanobacteria bacterium P01_H01_bin.150]
MFVRITFWLMLCLFIADIAQPGYLKFWQPDLTELSITDIRLPSLKFNKNIKNKSPRKTSTCPPPDNDLEEVIQAKFGCHNATPH